MMNHLHKVMFPLLLMGTLPAPFLYSQENVIASIRAGECSLSVEANERWETFRLRAKHPEYKNCAFTKDQVIDALNAAFRKTGSPNLEGTYTSLFLGRLIEYPWLSQHLAITAYDDRRWNKRKGKPTLENINKYVADLLFQHEVISQFDSTLAGGGYTVAGVSVEKVLVGRFKDVPHYAGTSRTGLIPFDAQVWFRLKRK